MTVPHPTLPSAPAGARVIVVAWTDMTGSEPTGRTVFRDGCHRPEYRACAKPYACVWSRDLTTEAGAKAYAKANGYAVHILPDTPDVLSVARALALAALAH